MPCFCFYCCWDSNWEEVVTNGFRAELLDEIVEVKGSQDLPLLSVVFEENEIDLCCGASVDTLIEAAWIILLLRGCFDSSIIFLVLETKKSDKGGEEEE